MNVPPVRVTVAVMSVAVADSVTAVSVRVWLLGATTGSLMVMLAVATANVVLKVSSPKGSVEVHVMSVGVADSVTAVGLSVRVWVLGVAAAAAFTVIRMASVSGDSSSSLAV